MDNAQLSVMLVKGLPNCWLYWAEVTDVIDGDTIEVMLDVGFQVYHKTRLRLARIDAYEMRGTDRPKGIKAKAFLYQLVETYGPAMLVRTSVVKNKDETDKYGRYIADLYYRDSEGNWDNVNDLMVVRQHAHYHEYKR